ncbi:MAG: HemX, putative uroporphyrinogen-III C-methyltransferase [Gammaproteobacteria bacterium]|jgi:hypothetical protein|nr:HemX, putative uroporphyrinogen-III C-methyltransferase [Gammaproteobacteria bacterium]
MSDYEQIRHFPVTIDASTAKVKGRKRATISLLIAFAALALSAYPFYKGYFQPAGPVTQDNAAAIAALQQSNQAMQNEMQQNEQTITALQTAQQSMMALLQSSHQPQVTLHRLNFESAKVSVQLAHALLWQHQDPAVISQQLDMAQDALAQSGPSAANLLKQVQSLNVLISALPKVDTTSVNSQLDQLAQGIANLEFVAPVNPPSTEQANIPDQTQLSGWRTGLQQSWQQLKSFLIIRSNNQIGPNLVSDSARFDAVRSLQLSINEAKWDAISGNSQYLNDLDQLQNQIQNYTVNNAAQQTWLNQLQTLRATPAVYPSDKLEAVEAAFSKVLNQFASR